MKNIFENLFGFLYTLSMGDYIFLVCTFLILVALIYVIYLIKKDDEKHYINKTEIDTLESIKETIEKEYKPETIILTDYEKEQEENAIISYDELIKISDKLYDQNEDVQYDDGDEPITIDEVIKRFANNEMVFENTANLDKLNREIENKEQNFIKAYDNE